MHKGPGNCCRGNWIHHPYATMTVRGSTGSEWHLTPESMYGVDDIFVIWTPEVKRRTKKGWCSTFSMLAGYAATKTTIDFRFMFFSSVKWEVCLFYLNTDKRILKGWGVWWARAQLLHLGILYHTFGLRNIPGICNGARESYSWTKQSICILIQRSSEIWKANLRSQDYMLWVTE